MISKEKRMNGGDDLQGEEENVADDTCRRCDGESQSMVVWVVLIRGGGYGDSQRLKESRRRTRLLFNFVAPSGFACSPVDAPP
ncbi:hypothetical protein PIB30_036113 [Stylosanthes scabra]|uniref:Uncharacterized protein n=1 Tax=Stylosanthes scabra TaxID=79078 RepID=A0ABU6VFF7_9FABA|nr:hypothetical protein [Stylosanthes scabra]